MTFLLADALVVRTPEQMRDAIVAKFVENQVNAVGWSPYSTNRALLEFDAKYLSIEEQIRATVALAGYLDTAPAAGDDWVDLLASGFFDEDRQPATKARHRFRITNDTAAGPFTIAERAQITTGDDVRFDVEVTGSLAAGVGQFAEVVVVAEKAGTSGNIPTGTTLKWIGSGIPGTTITNPQIDDTGTSILEQAADAEGNPSLIGRCRGRWGQNSAGGNDLMFRQWVKEAFKAAGVALTVTRVGVDSAAPDGPGSVRIYLANSLGPATAEELAIVAPYILARQTLGTGPWSVLAASTQTENIVATVYVSGNPNAAADSVAFLAAYANSLDVGPRAVYRGQLAKVLLSVPGVYDISITTPSVTRIDLASGKILAFNTSITVA